MTVLPRALGFELSRTGWRAVYVSAGPFRVTVRGCAEGPLDSADPDAAPAALQQATEVLGAAPGDRLGIAISRPVGHLRRIGLPRARRAAILENLEEQAPSIFPLGRQPAVVDVRRLNGRRRGDAEGLAAAAPRALLERLSAATSATRLQLRSVDMGAGALRALLGRGARSVIVAGESGIE